MEISIGNLTIPITSQNYRFMYVYDVRVWIGNRKFLFIVSMIIKTEYNTLIFF